MVRALYLTAGVADVAAETGDAALLQTSIGRWADMVAAKTYLSGGNGSRHEGRALATGSSCRRTGLTTSIRVSSAPAGPAGAGGARAGPVPAARALC